MGNTESTEVAVIPRVYYAYTKPQKAVFLGISKRNKPYVTNGMLERATIAVRPLHAFAGAMDIEYGISICSVDDNFSAEEGRKRALARLNAGFAKVTIRLEGETDIEKACKALLFNLTNAVSENMRKYQSRLAMHTERAKAFAEHPPVDVIV